VARNPRGLGPAHLIDQEIKNSLQSDPATRTRFGSLEFGVLVPDSCRHLDAHGPMRADKPAGSHFQSHQMFSKLYGRMKDQEMLKSVLDDVAADLKQGAVRVSRADGNCWSEHTTLVREMEQELRAAGSRAWDTRSPRWSGR